MLPALIVASLAVCAWAAWMVGPGAPLWARALAPVVAAAMLATSTYTLWRTERIFASLREANPAERQHLLSDGLAQAYRVLAAGGAAVLVAIVVLTVVRLRRS